MANTQLRAVPVSSFGDASPQTVALGQAIAQQLRTRLEGHVENVTFLDSYSELRCDEFPRHGGARATYLRFRVATVTFVVDQAQAASVFGHRCQGVEAVHFSVPRICSACGLSYVVHSYNSGPIAATRGAQGWKAAQESKAYFMFNVGGHIGHVGSICCSCRINDTQIAQHAA